VEELLINPATRKNLKAFVKQPNHAVLLTGQEGMGKLSISRLLAAEILGLKLDQLDNHPYTSIIAPDSKSKSISIESIRELRQFAKLKTLGKGTVRRIVIIADAHQMTIEAQNALLKLLEEPPEDTLLILTAVPNRGLLPTILSRLTSIRIQTPGDSDSHEFFVKKGFDARTIAKNYILSTGRPGMMASLLHGDDTHELVNAVKLAKQIVSSDGYGKMSLVNELSKNKHSVSNLLIALELVYNSLMYQAAQSQQAQKVQKYHQNLSQIHKLIELNQLNPNAKLLLTDLMWQL
jgi:DNA polymerase III subunit delta'